MSGNLPGGGSYGSNLEKRRRYNENDNSGGGGNGGKSGGSKNNGIIFLVIIGVSAIIAEKTKTPAILGWGCLIAMGVMYFNKD